MITWHFWVDSWEHPFSIWKRWESRAQISSLVSESYFPEPAPVVPTPGAPPAVITITGYRDEREEHERHDDREHDTDFWKSQREDKTRDDREGEQFRRDHYRDYDQWYGP